MGGNLRKMISCSARWFYGYIGLWASKWLLTDLLTGSSAIKDALNTLTARTDSAEGYTRIGGFFNVILENIRAYGNGCYGILAVVILIMLLRDILKSDRGGRKRLPAGVPYILLALYPLAWYFAAQNHSQEHWQFTCRILAGSVFAVLAGWAKVIGKEECGEGE